MLPEHGRPAASCGSRMCALSVVEGCQDRPALIDTHCHLNHPRLFRRLGDVLTRARNAGISDMIVVGYDLPSSRTAVELAAQHDGLWATVGIHPHDAASASDLVLGELRQLALSAKVVAIGETGLDFYRDLSPRDAQMRVFQRHLDLAAEVKLPVVIHCRDAQEAVLEVARERRQEGLVWHCFDGTIEQAERAIELGMALGFGGLVTRRGVDELRRVVSVIPADRLLLETDAPYLSPDARSRDNEPANVALVAEAVATVRGESVEGIATLTSANARRIFGLQRGLRC